MYKQTTEVEYILLHTSNKYFKAELYASFCTNKMFRGKKHYLDKLLINQTHKGKNYTPPTNNMNGYKTPCQEIATIIANVVSQTHCT